MTARILQGDVRERLAELPSDSFDCIVTSPPYWGLRDYGTAKWEGGSDDCDHKRLSYARDRETPGGRGGSMPMSEKVFRDVCGKCGARRIDSQIGLEPTLTEYLDTMVAVCRELRRVLKPSGTFWLNVGDSYAGSGRGGGGSYEAERKQWRDGNPAKNGGVSNRNGMGPVDGCKPKDLCMVPNRLAIRLQEDGWYVRSEIIWHKPNPMPESVTDRPTSSHEKIWLLTKSERYAYDAEAIKEESVTNDPRRPYGSQGSWELDGRPENQRPNGQLRTPANRKRGEFDGKTNALPGREAFRAFTETRNARNVWTIATQPYSEAHFATFPPELAERCIKAGCPVGGHVLDPFGGAGTTGMVADRLGRDATMIELNPAYVSLIKNRIAGDAGMFAQVAAE